jgi:hypothetical protein
MQQHILYDGIGALAVLRDLVEVAPQSVGKLIDLKASFLIKRRVLNRIPYLVDQFYGET